MTSVTSRWHPSPGCLSRRGRYGWSGGQGTNFYVDPDGTIGILLTQVEMGEQMGGMVAEFQALPAV